MECAMEMRVECAMECAIGRVETFVRPERRQWEKVCVCVCVRIGKHCEGGMDGEVGEMVDGRYSGSGTGDGCRECTVCGVLGWVYSAPFTSTPRRGPGQVVRVRPRTATRAIVWRRHSLRATATSPKPAPTTYSTPATSSPSTAPRRAIAAPDRRYTVEPNESLRGTALLQHDIKRLLSWWRRGGRGEFLEYRPGAFAEHYRRRPDVLLARALAIALPIADWYARYRLRQLSGRSSSGPAGREMDAESAASLRVLAVRLGATGIKIGQAFSNRPDAVGPTLMTELQKLQDDVGPFSAELAMASMARELGVRSAEEVFDFVTRDARGRPLPMASASLGQVYRARVRATGEEVAVKVQRPRLALDVPLDMCILRALAGWLKRRFRLRSDLQAILDEFGMRLFEEMDYVCEAHHAERFAALYAHGDDGTPADSSATTDYVYASELAVPRVYWHLTTRYVLTTEWIEGIKPVAWSDRDAPRLIRIGIECSLRQLLDEGFFHADPHPGNLLCTVPAGRLAYLDFGCMAELSAQRRYGLILAIVHLINGDFEQLARDFVELDFLPPDADTAPVGPALAAAFRNAQRVPDMARTSTRGAATSRWPYRVEPSTGARSMLRSNSSNSSSNGSDTYQLSNLNFAALSTNLADVAYRYPIRIPAAFSLVIRSLTILEGLALMHDPDFKIVDAVYPYVARRLMRDPAPPLRAAMREALLDGRTGRIRWRRLFSLLRQSGREVASVGDEEPVSSRNGVTGGRRRDEYIAGRTAAASTTTTLTSAQWQAALQYLFSDDGAFLRDAFMEEVVDTVDDAQLAIQKQLSQWTRGLVPSFGEPNYDRLETVREVLATVVLPSLFAPGTSASSLSSRGDAAAGYDGWWRRRRRRPHWAHGDASLPSAETLRKWLREIRRDTRMVMGKLAERNSIRLWQRLLRLGEDSLQREIEARKRARPTENTPPERGE